MNSRQRKKRQRQQACKEIKIIVGCKGMFRTENYEHMRKSIEYQMKAGSVIVLPAYLHVEAIIQAKGSRRIEIKRESEGDNEIQTVEKEL